MQADLKKEIHKKADYYEQRGAQHKIAEQYRKADAF
jgi:hypothetical protein